VEKTLTADVETPDVEALIRDAVANIQQAMKPPS
jgi:hypothetical protein